MYIKSDGTPWRPIVHIRDIIAAIVSVLEAPQDAIHNEIFNVGQTEENYRISELADIVAETVPGCHDRVRRRRRSRQALLPRQLRQDPACAAELSARNGPPAKGRRNCYEAYRARD